MERRAASRAATRQRILDAASELISERHTIDVQIAEIAERADVAPRTVYNHFPTIDELMGETMNQMTAEFVTLQPADILPGESASAAILRVITDWYERLEKHETMLETLIGVRNAPIFEQALTKARAARRERMETLLRTAAHERGSLADLKAVGAVTYALTGFAAWHALVREEGLSTQDAGRTVAELLVGLIGGEHDPMP